MLKDNKKTKIVVTRGDKELVQTKLKQQDTLDVSKYKYFKQNEIVNKIPVELAKPKQLSVMDEATTHNATDKKQGFYITLEDYSELEKNISDTLYKENKAPVFSGKLFDILNYKLTEQGFASDNVTISLKELSELLGKKDIKALRSQVKDNIEILKKLKFTFKGKKKRDKSYLDVHIYGGTSGIVNGQVGFKFNTDFIEILKGNTTYLQELNLNVLKCNDKTNPHQYLIYRAIEEFRRLNLEKVSKGLEIKVSWLYERVSTLPRYEEVMTKYNRAVTRYIIEPFERDLDNTGLKWQYKNDDTTSFDKWLNNSIIVTDLTLTEFEKNIVTKKFQEIKKQEKAKQRALKEVEKEKIASSESEA